MKSSDQEILSFVVHIKVKSLADIFSLSAPFWTGIFNSPFLSLLTLPFTPPSGQEEDFYPWSLVIRFLLQIRYWLTTTLFMTVLQVFVMMYFVTKTSLRLPKLLINLIKGVFNIHTGCKLCMIYIFLLINHYKQTKTGWAIPCFKILRTQKKFSSKGGRKGNATLK